MTSRSQTLARSTHPFQRAAAIVALSAAAWGISAQAGTPQATAGTDASAKDRAAIEASFARADANGDGKLTQEEAARLPAIAAKFTELDKDKDGALSLAEFTVGATAK